MELQKFDSGPMPGDGLENSQHFQNWMKDLLDESYAFYQDQVSEINSPSPRQPTVNEALALLQNSSEMQYILTSSVLGKEVAQKMKNQEEAMLQAFKLKDEAESRAMVLEKFFVPIYKNITLAAKELGLTNN